MAPVNDTVRLFAAIELPTEVKTELRQVVGGLRVRCSDNSLKWVATDSIHLTLKFLGETRSSQIDAVKESVARACSGTGELNLSLGRVGAFPSAARARVVWVGLEGDIPGLISLAVRLDRSLQPLGFEPETRRFSPHLTLARVRPDASQQVRNEISAAVSSARPPASICFTALNLSLMRSQLRPEGPLYTCLSQWPLGA